MDKVFECLAMLPVEQKRGQLCEFHEDDVEQLTAWNLIQLHEWGTFILKRDMGSSKIWRVRNARLTAAGVAKMAEAFREEDAGKQKKGGRWSRLLSLMGVAELNAVAAHFTPKVFDAVQALLASIRP